MTTVGARVDTRVQVHYQPIVDLHDGRTEGVEALARFRAVDGSLIAPAAFIERAEQTADILDLGRAVRRMAIPQVAAWSRRCGRTLDLHVNVSPREFDAELVPTVLEALARAGLPPSALVLEITDSRPFADAPEAATVVQVAREQGIRIALDHFGVGWSSVDRLNALDVDLVKIDRSFVATDVETPVTLQAAIVSYARRRGLQVVASGIERPEDVSRSVELGCRRGQGMLLGPPGAAAELTPSITSPDPVVPLTAGGADPGLSSRPQRPGG